MKYYYIRGEMGDIIYSIPAIKASGGGVIITGLPREQFEYLKPLIEYQGIGFRHESDGIPPGFINLEGFRGYAKEGHHLAMAFARVLNVFVDIRKAWLIIPPGSSTGHFSQYSVINVTSRYRDKLFSYRKLTKELIKEGNVLFIGKPEEYRIFKEQYNAPSMIYQQAKDALFTAQVIDYSVRFIGNQSHCLAIAEGLGRSYMYERAPNLENDNTRTGRPNEIILNKNTRKWHVVLNSIKRIYHVFTKP